MDLNTTVRIGDRTIGTGFPTFIIAEAGVNHFGSVEIAKHLVDMAVIARADAVKFQIFKVENLISGEAPEWIHRMKSKELPFHSFERLKEYCEKKGIMFLATAHDEESLDFYSTLDPHAFKIGSGEVSNPDFLRRVARNHKPVILSTGMYDEEEVASAVEIFLSEKNRQMVLLHCVTCYPALPEDINLRAINHLQEEFGCPVGYSDHSMGNDIALAAVSLGASAVEKHIAVSKGMPGSQDCPVSCDEKDLIELVNGIRRIEMALGSGEKKPSEREELSRLWARKSIVARVDIQKGAIIAKELLCMKRPGSGLAPKDISKVLGMRALRDIKADTVISLEDIGN